MEIVYVSISQKIVKKNNQQSFKLSIHISSLFAFGILSVKIFNIYIRNQFQISPEKKAKINLRKNGRNHSLLVLNV